MQGDRRWVGRQPFLPFCREIVVGRIVDDEEHLSATGALNELFEKGEERGAVEHRGEAVNERGIVKCNRPEDVRRLSLAVGVDPRLTTTPCPCPVQRAIQPKAGFVLEEDYASAAGRFFLIAGSRVRSQWSWAA